MTIVMRMMMNDQSLMAFMIAVVSLKCNSKVKVKVKVYPRTGLEGPEGE